MSRWIRSLPADTVEHKPGCEAPVVMEQAGKYGDTLARCRVCGGVSVLVPAAQAPVATPEPALPQRPASYRCRDHLDQPVNWRGRGCPICDRRKRRRKRTGGGPVYGGSLSTAGVAGPILASARTAPVFSGGDAA